jgi:hypothetical protein
MVPAEIAGRRFRRTAHETAAHQPEGAMPFDGTERDLTVPSLANLAYLLRHRELWPAGFHWNYAMSSCCALGLARRRWGQNAADPDFGQRPGGTIVIPQGVFSGLGHKDFGAPDYDRVQPDHVADAIDRHLVQQPVVHVLGRLQPVGA